MEENVVLTVPAQRAYLLVIRTALGGVALVNDLDVDTLDDLRQAADEACDCLMHQGAPAHTLRMESRTADTHLLVTLFASLDEVPGWRCLRPCWRPSCLRYASIPALTDWWSALT